MGALKWTRGVSNECQMVPSYANKENIIIIISYSSMLGAIKWTNNEKSYTGYANVGIQ